MHNVQCRYWGLGATYDDHLRLIGKRVVDWGATSEYRFKIGNFAPTNRWPKISGRRGRTPPAILLLRKLGLNDLSYDIKISTYLSSVLLQSTHMTDGRTYRRRERRTDSFFVARPRLHSMQCGKNDDKSTCSNVSLNNAKVNKMLSYRRETALQGAL